MIDAAKRGEAPGGKLLWVKVVEVSFANKKRVVIRLDFAEALTKLPLGLNARQAAEAMGMILAGEVPDVQIAAFLYGLKVKGETRAEIEGIVDSLRSSSLAIEGHSRVLDIVGTGGDRTGAINVSTPAAILVAAATGVPVAKHGNRGSSNAIGSADLVESLGVPLSFTPDQVSILLQRAGFCFCFAPVFHPALRHMANARRGLGVATLINFLAPLLNPCSPEYQLVGVAQRDRLELMANLLSNRTEGAIVASGKDGLDKFTTSDRTSFAVVRGGAVEYGEMSPEDVGVSRISMTEMRGGSAPENAARIVKVLQGNSFDPLEDLIVLNAAAAAWVACGQGMDAISGIREFIPVLRDALDVGRVMFFLNEWTQTAQTLHASEWK